MKTCNAIMTRSMNNKATVTVKTPFRETNEFQLESVVKQGGVAGRQLIISTKEEERLPQCMVLILKLILKHLLVVQGQ